MPRPPTTPSTASTVGAAPRPRGSTRRRAALTGTALTLALATGALGEATAAPSSAEALAAEDGPNEDALVGVTEVVTKLKPDETIQAVNARYGTTVVDQITVVSTYLLAPPAGTSPSELVAQMADDPALEWVEPNYAESQPEGNPTYRWSDGVPQVVGRDPLAWRKQPALTQVRAAAAHTVTKGAGTVVAVVDTGFRLAHPSLAGRFTSSGYDFVDDDAQPGEARNFTDDDGDGRVDEGRGHGTHVAGIVAAVAPQARIMPLRVLDDEGIGYVWTTAEAIRWASERDADVINLSLGSAADSELLEEAVDDAEDDAVVVASAGNDNRTTPQWPAADDEALGVASVSRTDVRSPFSNYGSWVDVAAPGQRVVSTFPNRHFARWDGTSMAAPFVAGQAALLRAHRPRWEAEDVAEHIERTAVAAGRGLGGGRIDLAASLGVG